MGRSASEDLSFSWGLFFVIGSSGKEEEESSLFFSMRIPFPEPEDFFFFGGA